MRVTKILFLLIAVFAIGIAEDVCAYKVILRIDKIQAFVNPSNSMDRRVVAYVELPDKLMNNGISIDFATISFRANVSNDIAGTIEIYPVISEWEAMGVVSWEYPWKEPGGDFSTSDRTCRYTLKGEIGSKDLIMDISNIVKSWTDGSLLNRGILIKLSKNDLDRQMANYQLSSARMCIEIFYSEDQTGAQ
jgi:hypothetical protein